MEADVPIYIQDLIAISISIPLPSPRSPSLSQSMNKLVLRTSSHLFLFLLLLLLLISSIPLMASANVVLMGTNITLSFDDIEANFAPTVKASGETGILYMAQPVDACSQLINTADMYPNTTSPFVLIIRGACSFEDKVRRAHTAGFKAAIIYDDEDGGILVASYDLYVCSTLLRLEPNSKIKECWANLCTDVAGNSAGIKIHAVFIAKTSGEVLKKYAGRSDMELWIIPSFENRHGR